jgi:hypothetical protein
MYAFFIKIIVNSRIKKHLSSNKNNILTFALIYLFLICLYEIVNLNISQVFVYTMQIFSYLKLCKSFRKKANYCYYYDYYWEK